jgi:F0F1-type ATP synthase membrane subunit b/b'
MLAPLFLFALQAAEGAHQAGGIPEWVPKTVNLAIFLTFLYFILRKPAANFFEARRTAIVADLERAKREKAEAEAKLAEVEARLGRLAAEQEEIHAEAEREAEAEHVRIAARADEEARKIADMAGREIEGALKAARADLQRFAAEKAVELAEGTIRAEMNDEDRKRMVDEYAQQLEGETK